MTPNVAEDRRCQDERDGRYRLEWTDRDGEMNHVSPEDEVVEGLPHPTATNAAHIRWQPPRRIAKTRPTLLGLLMVFSPIQLEGLLRSSHANAKGP
jgi:hypothetical protein